MFTRKIITILLTILFLGCSSAPTFNKITFPITVAISTDNRLNLADQVANPVGIRVYQLTKSETFESAEFIDLFQNGRDVLADELVKHSRLYPVMPDTTKLYDFDILPEVRYLAVLIELTHFDQSEHRAIVELPENILIENEFMLNIREKTVKLSLKEKEKSIWTIITDFWEDLL